ncbi:MAG: hydroxymethylpyrimidine/phosphomethylpyrimidine kinase [Candidatus Cloacimonetes bacterium]|jgi:hydroxymethylpyrimidine/phosphomethylpyrimidine kinase|nr:hydroxymethylpyrimidine/phosphomethylpyrimidine kinase [Candidatus Cloacimonadota bacterium]MBT6994801.1 hydroxymethylpyrimidine/phosphomethylpyrimidine kinase [Candidatus Cloacimonadota bacterium]MBT7470102.1 hydroxymethylpyrimidine/phosphomethylpyrimidine kinase [Candidatus Cloacimonadota bacterium]
MQACFLTIAAADNSGGAGIQQDLRVAEKLGFWGLSAITGLTVQDFDGLDKIHPTNPQILKAQIEKCFRSFDVNSVKIGAICSNENLQIIVKLLKKYQPKIIVLDTVFAPTNGDNFIKNIELFKNELMPLSTFITPNKDELEKIANQKIYTFEEAVKIGKNIVQKYDSSIYLTGGHFAERKEALITKNKTQIFQKEKWSYQYKHGTGCAFSSAFTCFLTTEINSEVASQKASKLVEKLYKKFNSSK